MPPARSDSPEPLLSMEGIAKAFGGVAALDGASLSIRRGEVHALIGQNGAGKSTMIKILNGAYRRDAGTVRFDGAPALFRSPHEAQTGGVSTIFQEVNLIPYRSVTENIVLGREPRRWGMIDWARAHATARAAVARFGLDIDVRRPLNRHNIAIQQLVAIARAVSFDARLVIMDEPTSSLDEQEKAVLFDVIRGLRSDGVSVLYVSHHLEELFAVCDRVSVMRDGRRVAVHDIADVTRLDLVSEMIGRDAGEIERSGTTGFRAGARAGGTAEPAVPMLEVAGLGDGRAVRDVSFALARGEILGLAGLLGSGRSETCELVFGTRKPANGTIRVRGEAAAFRGPKDAISEGIGFCTEDRKVDGIVPELSIRDNMSLALLPRLARRGTIPLEEEARLVDGLIDALGIKCVHRDQPIRELSGGNQQKVLLGRWLLTRPDLLILDEPTRGIDVGAKRQIQTLIDGLAEEGMAILMISSEFEEIVEGATRVTVLHEGRSVATLDHAGLTEDRLLEIVAGGGAPAEGRR